MLAPEPLVSIPLGSFPPCSGSPAFLGLLVSDLGPDLLQKHPRGWKELWTMLSLSRERFRLHLSGDQAARVVIIHLRMKWVSVFTRQVALSSPSPLERGTPASHPGLLGTHCPSSGGDAKRPSIPPTLSCCNVFRNV